MIPTSFASRSFTRRTALKTLGWSALATATSPAWLHTAESNPSQAPASAAVATTNSPVYHFRIGAIDALILSDGGGVFQPPESFWPADATPKNVPPQLAAAFLPTDRTLVSCNVLALRLGKELVIVDVGAGANFGPAMGHLPQSLAAAGLQPRDVTAVIISHAHVDHIGGLADSTGRPTFPNAHHFIRKTELDYWLGPKPDTSAMLIPPERRAGTVEMVKKLLTPFKDRFTPLQAGEKLFDAIEVVDAPGHTPGHIALHIRSEGEELLHLADAVHHAVLSLGNPTWRLAFDSVPAQAIETRKKFLAQAAANRTRLLGYHLSFPGLGHVTTAGSGFHWTPEPWNLG